MTGKSFFKLMDEAADHLAKKIAKSGGGDDTMPLDEAADAFKALVQYATLKLKYREEDDGKDGNNFTSFARDLQAAEKDGTNGETPVRDRARRQFS